MSRLGRRLAFDYGDVRIGVAVCDPDGILATPLVTLQTKDPHLLREILSLIEEYEPVKIYLGNPKLLSGNSGEAVEKVLVFQSRLHSFLQSNLQIGREIPVVLVDERLSTVNASKNLKAAGVSARQAKSTIDQMAAVEILEQGLANDR
jgi:putative Holliday junction resolvase